MSRCLVHFAPLQNNMIPTQMRLFSFTFFSQNSFDNDVIYDCRVGTQIYYFICLFNKYHRVEIYESFDELLSK